jgi:hypothetical protein
MKSSHREIHGKFIALLLLKERSLGEGGCSIFDSLVEFGVG